MGVSTGALTETMASGLSVERPPRPSLATTSANHPIPTFLPCRQWASGRSRGSSRIAGPCTRVSRSCPCVLNLDRRICHPFARLTVPVHVSLELHQHSSLRDHKVRWPLRVLISGREALVLATPHRQDLSDHHLRHHHVLPASVKAHVRRRRPHHRQDLRGLRLLRRQGLPTRLEVRSCRSQRWSHLREYRLRCFQGLRRRLDAQNHRHQICLLCRQRPGKLHVRHPQQTIPRVAQNRRLM